MIDDPGPNLKVSERGRCDYNFVVCFNFGVMTFVRHTIQKYGVD